MNELLSRDDMCMKSQLGFRTTLAEDFTLIKFKPVLLNQFDGLSTEQKIANLEYFLLEFGRYTSVQLSAAFFDKTPQPDIRNLFSNSFNTDFDLSEWFSH